MNLLKVNGEGAYPGTVLSLARDGRVRSGRTVPATSYAGFGANFVRRHS